MTTIPDPFSPESVAIDSQGRLMPYGIFVIPLDDDGNPVGERRHVGWAYSVEIEFADEPDRHVPIEQMIHHREVDIDIDLPEDWGDAPL